MNKNELINAVTESSGVNRNTVAAVIEDTFSAIVRTVNKGDDVTVTGFGVFERRHRARRVARNPRTGEKVKVRATNVPAFRASKSFKDIVAKRTKIARTGSVIKRGESAAPAPVKKAAPVKRVTPTKAAPLKKAAPAKKAAAPAKSAPAKKAAAPAKKAAPAAKRAPRKAAAK